MRTGRGAYRGGMEACAYLVFGDEYLVSARAAEIVRSLVPPGNEALGLEIFDGRVDTVAEAEALVRGCIQSLLTVGLLGGEKVVWLRSAGFLVDNVIGRSPTVKDALNDLATVVKSGLPGGHVLVISAPVVDKRFALYKAMTASGKVEAMDVPDNPRLRERRAAECAQSVLRDAGVAAERNALAGFLERVGSETRQVVNEAEKVATYVGDRKAMTLSDVNAVTCFSREVSQWGVANAFAERDLSGALRMLRLLLSQKQSAIGIAVGLARTIKELLVFREALDRNWVRVVSGDRSTSVDWTQVPPEIDTVLSEKLARDPRDLHSYRAGNLAAQAGRFTMVRLRRCHRIVLKAHETLVSTSQPEDLVLELALVRMLA